MFRSLFSIDYTLSYHESDKAKGKDVKGLFMIKDFRFLGLTFFRCTVDVITLDTAVTLLTKEFAAALQASMIKPRVNTAVTVRAVVPINSDLIPPAAAGEQPNPDAKTSACGSGCGCAKSDEVQYLS